MTLSVSVLDKLAKLLDATEDGKTSNFEVYRKELLAIANGAGVLCDYEIEQLIIDGHITQVKKENIKDY